MMCSPNTKLNLDVVYSGGDTRNEKEQGGGGGALFSSSVLARTATLDLTNFSSLNYFTSRKFIAKTDLYQAEPFLFLSYHYLTPQHLLHWNNDE